MKKFILWLARPIIIRKLNDKSFGEQFINTVLEALELPQCGLPVLHNPPPPPPTELNHKFNAFDALQKSFLSFDEVLYAIESCASKHFTVLPYVLISHETAEKLRQLGYSVKENLGGGLGIPKGVSTIRWDDPGAKNEKNCNGVNRKKPFTYY